MTKLLLLPFCQNYTMNSCYDVSHITQFHAKNLSCCTCPTYTNLLHAFHKLLVFLMHLSLSVRKGLWRGILWFAPSNTAEKIFSTIIWADKPLNKQHNYGCVFVLLHEQTYSEFDYWAKCIMWAKIYIHLCYMTHEV